MKNHIRNFFFIALTFSCLSAQGITIGNNVKFSPGTSRIYVSNNIINSGMFDADSCTIVFNGKNNNQIINDNNGGYTFHNIIVNKSGGDVILSSGISVNGIMKLISGDVNLNGKIITLGSKAMLSETAGNTVKGDSGYVVTVCAMEDDLQNADVGGLGAIFSISNTSPADLIQIKRGTAVQSADTGSGISRYYDIEYQKTQNNIKLVFKYDESELNGIDENNLKLYNSKDTGKTWTNIESSVDTSSNLVTAVKVNINGRWTLAGKMANITSVKGENTGKLPIEFALMQNYPNPFNPTTTIRYQVPSTEYAVPAGRQVVLKIYNILGQEVATLVNEQQIAGNYKVTFNASNLASGIYIYRLQAGEYTASRKMLMLK